MSEKRQTVLMDGDMARIHPGAGNRLFLRVVEGGVQIGLWDNDLRYLRLTVEANRQRILVKGVAKEQK